MQAVETDEEDDIDSDDPDEDLVIDKRVAVVAVTVKELKNAMDEATVKGRLIIRGHNPEVVVMIGIVEAKRFRMINRREDMKIMDFTLSDTKGEVQLRQYSPTVLHEMLKMNRGSTICVAGIPRLQPDPHVLVTYMKHSIGKHDFDTHTER